MLRGIPRRSDDRLQLGLFGRQRVEIGVLVGIGGVHLVQPLLGRLDFAQTAFHRLANRLFRVKLRLLRQVSDLDARHRNGFALDLFVDTGHDLEQRGLARSIQAKHADLGAGEEGQRDVLEDFAFRRHDLADAVHAENVLSHGVLFEDVPGKKTARLRAQNLELSTHATIQPPRAPVPCGFSTLLGTRKAISSSRF